MRTEPTFYVNEQDLKRLRTGPGWTLMIGDTRAHILFDLDHQSQAGEVVVSQGKKNGKHKKHRKFSDAMKKKILAYAAEHSPTEAIKKFKIRSSLFYVWKKKGAAK